LDLSKIFITPDYAAISGIAYNDVEKNPAKEVDHVE
jgi:hypothetical protein